MAESTFKLIGEYKDNFIKAIKNNNDILESMLGTGYTEDDVNGITYSQLFPYLYVDETQQDAKSYICIEIDPAGKTRTMQQPTIYIWVYCHKSIMKYYKDGYRGTRVDILVDMVDRTIRNLMETNPRSLGIGELSFEKAPYFFPATNYYGRQLIYTTSDFKLKKV